MIESTKSISDTILINKKVGFSVSLVPAWPKLQAWAKATYYDIEGKDKDDNEDESSRPILNKKASTYACMQASSPMGKPALQRSNREDSTRMYSDVKLECQ